jgi:hypothetical protein
MIRAVVPVAMLAMWGAASAAAQTIETGRNVQVSKGHPGDTHYEVLVAADPGNASRIIVGSFRYPAGTTRSGTVVYTSRDGGKTWGSTLEGNALENTSDPALAFGTDGSAYYSAAWLGPSGTPRERREMLMFRSQDGGVTWNPPVKFTYSDREYITVDRTNGKYRGRIYVNGNNRVPYGVSDFVIFRSSDNGKTWQGPGKRRDFGKHTVGMMGNAVVASDGTIIGVFEENNDIRAIRSIDGGETLTDATDADTSYVEPGNRKGSNNNVTAIPAAAIDASAGPHRDKVYAVWADRRSGHSRIRLASSADKGVTWSPSIEIDAMTRSDTTDNFMPAVAVNRDGTVAVMWYDRRDHPDNLGWDVRMSASMDGGKTFLPPVKVSEKGMGFGPDARWTALRAAVTKSRDTASAPLILDVSLNTFTYLGGDTNGLVADAAGVFHPVWVDNRNGVPQIWTAPVRVLSARERGTDISDKVSVDVSNASFDPSTGVVTVVARLHNTSGATLRGPFTGRVTDFDSELGSPDVTGNDWTFPEISLAPGAWTQARTWRFVLENRRPYRNGSRYRLGLLKMRFAVTRPADP